jgi:hypothetical protein
VGCSRPASSIDPNRHENRCPHRLETHARPACDSRTRSTLRHANGRGSLRLSWLGPHVRERSAMSATSAPATSQLKAAPKRRVPVEPTRANQLAFASERQRPSRAQLLSPFQTSERPLEKTPQVTVRRRRAEFHRQGAMVRRAISTTHDWMFPTGGRTLRARRRWAIFTYGGASEHHRNQQWRISTAPRRAIGTTRFIAAHRPTRVARRCSRDACGVIRP